MKLAWPIGSDEERSGHSRSGTEESCLVGSSGRLTAFDGSGEAHARSGGIGMEGVRSSDSGESGEYVVSRGRAIASRPIHLVVDWRTDSFDLADS